MLNAACINAAAIISEFLAARSIRILRGEPAAIDKAPQIKVSMSEAILFSERRNTSNSTITISSKSKAVALIGLSLSANIPPR